MGKHLREMAQQLLRSGFEAMSERERSVITRFAQGTHVVRDANRAFETELTFGARLADRVAAFGGSWTFIIIFWSVLLAWIVANSLLLAPREHAFDPYPYILLNLVLSMLAAVQAPIIMMSQNRQAAKDRLQADLDYEVNMKAELEISQLHAKFDHLHNQQLELLEMQREQMRLTTAILRRQIGRHSGGGD
jgi:uncharacterized membrane protein